MARRLYSLAIGQAVMGHGSVLTSSHKRGRSAGVGVGVVAGVGSIDGDFEGSNSIQRTFEPRTSGIGVVRVGCRVTELVESLSSQNEKYTDEIPMLILVHHAAQIPQIRLFKRDRH